LASQRRFEGPVLEDLLDRVRAEAGPSAQIVAANRVRKGGLGGFFAREFFEVIVDIADAPVPEPEPVVVPAPVAAVPAMATTAPARRADGTRRIPASILDLAEAVNNTERSVRAVADRELARPTTPTTLDLAAVDPDHDLIDLVEDTSPAPAADPNRFASILERIAHQIEPMIDDEDDDGPIPAAHAPAVPTAPTAPATPSVPAASVAPVSPTRPAPSALQPAPETSRRTATAARVTDDAILAEERLLITPTAFGARTTDAQPAAFRRVPRTEAVIERPETSLARLGLPARLVPRGVAPSELRGALIETLAELPPTPALPQANGVVIAVIGTGSSAVLLARELCAEHGLDPERIVLATQEPLGAGIPAWLQICDAATAEERRRAWSRRGTPTIVAVSLPPGRNSLGWARDILDHLEPTIAWSIVNAGWKSEDVRDWVERLGGVDVLALSNLDDTVSPAAALELGVPVGRIDNAHATAIRWSELLMARIER
jgi:hypothetical protein